MPMQGGRVDRSHRDWLNEPGGREVVELHSAGKGQVLHCAAHAYRRIHLQVAIEPEAIHELLLEALVNIDLNLQRAATGFRVITHSTARDALFLRLGPYNQGHQVVLVDPDNNKQNSSP